MAPKKIVKNLEGTLERILEKKNKAEKIHENIVVK